MGTLQFTGGFAVPGMGLTRETYEDAIWRENYDANRPYYSQQTIDGSSRDVGNLGTTYELRAGLLMGKRNLGTVGDNQASHVSPWDPTATDGTEEIWGPLLVTTNTQHLSADNDKWVGWVLVGGLIRSASIIIPGQESAGLEGQALGNLVRESMANSGRFRFDDGPHDWQGNGYKMMPILTADYTLSFRDSGKAFVLDNSTVTLPVVAGSRGVKFTFYGGASGGTITEASAGDLLPANNQTVPANGKAEVIGLDGTNYLFTEQGQIP